MNTKFNLLLFLSLALSQFVHAQEDYGRKLVKTLASDKFAGRGYVFQGDKKAAAFIAKEMKKSGLSPLGDSFMQPFNLPANVFPKAASVALNGSDLKIGANALIDAASPSVYGAFEVLPVNSNLNNLQNLKGLVLDKRFQGKAILLDEEAQLAHMKPEEWRRVVMTLMQEGQHAVLLVKTKAKFTWRAGTSQAKKPAVYIKDVNFDQPKNEIVLDITAYFQPQYSTQNVCGFLKGTGNSDSTIVITAHYDHLGAIGKKVVFNGANDNDSGTALMLYLAQYYGKNKPKYNMIFLAFSGEESGLLGSKYYVANPRNELSKVKFLLNLDMAGTGDDGIQVVNGTIFTKAFDTMKAINAEKGYLPDVKVRGPMNRSDHAPFYEKGVPSFFIYTLGGIAAYHDICDRYETLPFTKFNGYANLLTDFIATF